MNSALRSLMATVLVWIALAPYAAEPGVMKHPYPGGGSAEIWALGGQSNMAGAGTLPDPLPPPDPRIQLFNMDNRWIPAQDPINRVFDAVAPVFHEHLTKGKGLSEEEYQKRREASRKQPAGGVNCALFFARHLRKSLDRPIGLVPNSPGGSSMEHWNPARRNEGGNSFYGAMMDRIEMVGGVRGLIWYQGEGETEKGRVEVYERNLLNFIDSVRRDANQPDLPILYVQIAQCMDMLGADGDRGWEQVREIQRQAMSKRPGVYMVSAIDLPHIDSYHINTEGQQRLGQRLAEVALSKVYMMPGHGLPIDLTTATAVNPRASRPQIRVKFSGVTGRLQAVGRAQGFEVRYPNVKGRAPQVCRVDFDPADPSAVILNFGAPLQQPVQLFYGAGLNTYCNIVDDKDIPLPAFGPLEVAWLAEAGSK